ncbi:SDR family oxidoreductase [Paenarthrobacter sp. AT5]|uniref:SDR family oxidoreductase n=1 Tax=Paenarthrobacter TaxID=1742992 RepID=UPI001A97D77E|nr:MULTISPECIES: SDR family oxidoreductase [Paenarthrobacter]QSZ54021.1 short-chain dehydrogenase [Paenarthrobacter ureafaciens]WOC62809.1 SDR family oxidoreductase [Paenarthrobacter sp. AT5]BCW84040.1 short-chain dehydrogenase [Arthrobacter sp. NicSoilE8]
MGLLNNKVLLISGGTQGLGAGVARRAAAEGAAGIAITGRNADSGEQLAAELTSAGVETRFIKTDLADVEQARNSVLETVSAFGKLDCTVNAAGLTTRGTMLDTTPDLFDAHIAVNLKSPFFIMAETIKHLRSRKSPGSILNVISIAELGGQPYLAPYVAAKAGLAGVTRNAAHAHRWDKIRINGLDIGWTATDGEAETQKKFHGAGEDWLEKANASVPMGKLGQVDEIAEFIVFLLSDRSGVVTGSVIDWDQNVLGGSD